MVMGRLATSTAVESPSRTSSTSPAARPRATTASSRASQPAPSSTSAAPGTSPRTLASARALAAAYGACQRACGLLAGEAPLVGGGSDACTTGAMGIPSIDGLGPRGKAFHTREEQVELGSIVPKAQALLRYLASLG